MLDLKSSSSLFVRLIYFGLYCYKLFLHLMLKVYVYQKDNVSNQREQIIHLLANEQSRLHTPEESEPVNLKSFLSHNCINPGCCIRCSLIT